ncbi:MAG: ABC transporter permease [Treponema sp.]|jgi:peptide/nickel transport system permease protein|nr:ABC transporter permease [Treponema sp.]
MVLSKKSIKRSISIEIARPEAAARDFIRKKLLWDQREQILRRILRNKRLVTGSFVVLVFIFIALFAPFLAPQDPNFIDMSIRLKPPSPEHIFGTDTLGRDVFARVVYGARVSLTVGLGVGLFSGIIGLVIGLYASYNHFLDQVFMRICDGLKAIPGILLSIMIMAVLGADIKNVIISLVIVRIPNVSRVARSVALSVREQTYIDVMRSLGASPSRILWGHIAPNILSPVLVQMTFAFVSAIPAEAALSFLGAGVPLSQPSWGSILSEGRQVIYSAWWLIAYPGIFTAVSVLGLNLVGEGLRDFLDPKTE